MLWQSVKPDLSPLVSRKQVLLIASTADNQDLKNLLAVGHSPASVPARSLRPEGNAKRIALNRFPNSTRGSTLGVLNRDASRAGFTADSRPLDDP